MKHFLGINVRPPAIEQSFEAAKRKLQLPIDIVMKNVPLIEFSLLAEDIQLKHKKHNKILILTYENF